jgi:hypothetical protein
MRCVSGPYWERPTEALLPQAPPLGDERLGVPDHRAGDKGRPWLDAYVRFEPDHPILSK